MGKTRVNTAMPYMQRWSKRSEWLQATRGLIWPTEPCQLVDYLHLLEDQPCGPSVSQAWLQAVQWVHKTGGYKGLEDHSTSTMVLQTVENPTAKLSAGTVEKWQAPRFPVALLAVFEVYIRDGIHSVSTLLTNWAIWRFDDMQRLHR